MVGRSSGDERRRGRERGMVQEGLDLLRKKKEDEWRNKIRDQRELREMLTKYSPWGKPGCGAPNPNSIRKRNLHMEELYPEKEKGSAAAQLGRPGGGAPRRTDSGHVNPQLREDPALRFQDNPQGRRCVDNVLRYRTGAPQQQTYRRQLDQMVQEKSRLKNEESRRMADYEKNLGWTDETTFKCMANQNYYGYQNGTEQGSAAAQLGRPGGGAPRRTDSGHVNPQLREDPALRFQDNPQGRRCVDNVLRYRTGAPQQQTYRRQLDQMVQEKSRLKNEESRRMADYEKNLGWTDETTFKCMANQNYYGYQNGTEQACGGVELVPLLARRRTAASGERHPLSSTDVTKARNDPRRWAVHPESSKEYTHELGRQILTKQQQLQESRRQDAESSRRHFETWQQLWGRPGHGAPRDVKAKGNLDALLHRLAVK